MSTKSGTNDAMQTKMINATSRLVPMHLQIKALKSLMKAKKKALGSTRPQVKTRSTQILEDAQIYRNGMCF